MTTTIDSLTDARNFSNGFGRGAPVPHDFGQKTARSGSGYDLRRLLRGGREGGFEREVSEEIRRSVPDLFGARGPYVPWSVFTRGEGSLSQRDVTAGGATTGASFIELERLPTIADALRPVSQTVASGCTVLDNLKDNITWPRWATPSTPAAYTEIAPVTGNTQTSSALQLSAHRISTMTIQLERLIQLEMLRSIGSMIDQYALSGAGGTQPLGLLNYGQNALGARDLSKLQPPVVFAGPATWAKVTSFPASVESTDIADDGSFGWIVSPSTKYRWAQEAKVATFPEFLYEDGRVGDNPLRASNVLSSTHQAIFGRWSDLVLGLWPISILLDPVSQATAANVRVFIDVFADTGALRGPSFCISSDAANQ